MNEDGAVFLDRDGVLIEHVHHLCRVEDVQLTPGAREAVSALNRAGIAVVLVTNQSVVARGKCSEQELAEIHAHLAQQLAPARLDGLYYCPHLPPDGGGEPEPPYRVACGCRKPAPGMLQRAARELGIDLGRSLMIGDSTSDLEAGRRAGTESALVRTGFAGSDARFDVKTERFENLAEATRWWLARLEA